MGYQDVLATIHENFEYIPITSSFILQLHRDLYKYSEKTIGGKFKSTQNYITEKRPDATSYTRFMPLEAYETPKAIEDICVNYNEIMDKGLLNPLLLIPIFIYDFLCIHPFNDGNGRMSRLLTTLLLYKSGYLIGRYISLEEAGIGWHDDKEDPTPFIKYILGIILSAYKDFENRVDIFNEKPSALEQVRDAAQLKIGKFTKSEMMELCPNLSRASVENSLSEFVKENYLERHGKGRGTFYTRKT